MARRLLRLWLHPCHLVDFPLRVVGGPFADLLTVLEGPGTHLRPDFPEPFTAPRRHACGDLPFRPDAAVFVVLGVVLLCVLFFGISSCLLIRFHRAVKSLKQEDRPAIIPKLASGHCPWEDASGHDLAECGFASEIWYRDPFQPHPVEVKSDGFAHLTLHLRAVRPGGDAAWQVR